MLFFSNLNHNKTLKNVLLKTNLKLIKTDLKIQVFINEIYKK